MLDEFKIFYPIIDLQRLRSSYDFRCQVVRNTGEELTWPQSYEEDGLKFLIGKNKITNEEFVHIEGSFHKFRNKGDHNHDDFLFTDIPGIIQEMCQSYFMSTSTVLNNLAFGVNLIVPFEPDIILRHFIMYKDTMFDRMKISEGNGVVCIKPQFICKIYNKGKQYNLKGYILRIEIKVTRMQFFETNKVNIHTLQDLLNIENLLPLTNLLQRKFDDCLLCDPSINEPNLKAKERELLANGKRASYWSEMRTPGSPDYGKQRKQYEREMKQFKELVKRLRGNEQQETVSKLLHEKLELIRTDALQYLGANLPTSDFGHIQPKGTNLQLNYSVDLPHPETVRICGVCGEDITHKKKNALFCSKKCKNAFTNPKLNPRNNLIMKIQRRSVPGLLFPVSDSITLTPEQMNLLDRPNSINY